MEVYAFGHNGYGRLGVGDTDHRAIPCVVSFPVNVVHICCGAGHNLAITGISYIIIKQD